MPSLEPATSPDKPDDQDQDAASITASEHNPKDDDDADTSPVAAPLDSEQTGPIHSKAKGKEKEPFAVDCPPPAQAEYTNISVHPVTGDMVFAPIPNREYHEGFMRQAIGMAEMALASDETPVGCVFVRQGEVIGRGINGTNASLNGTRHAEFVALAEIMATYPQSILKDTDLYVTVEPCIMCASALRQYGIRAVYFGCLNDRFGGTGGVMTVHMDEGVDPPFPVYGGLFREEAIMLLRRFYVQENDKAPEPKPKKNRELKTDILPIEVVEAAKAKSPIIGTPMPVTPAVSTPTTEEPAG